MFWVLSVSVLGAGVLGGHGGGLAECQCFQSWALVISLPASNLVSLLLNCCVHRVSQLGLASSEAGWLMVWIGAIEQQYGWVHLTWGQFLGGG